MADKDQQHQSYPGNFLYIMEPLFFVYANSYEIALLAKIQLETNFEYCFLIG